MMALALNDVPIALKALSKACDLKDNAYNRYILGLAFLAQGDVKRAIELMRAMQ